MAEAYRPPSGGTGCLLRAGAARARIEVDRFPQAVVRVDREEEEYGQNVLWSHSSGYPVPIDGLGSVAAWLPAARTVIAGEGSRFVRVVVTGAHDPEPLAIAVARAAR